MPLNPLQLVRRILAWLWRILTWIRVGLANILFLILILLLVMVLLPREELSMPDSIALRVAPSGFLVDQYSYIDPLTQILNRGSDQHLETRVRDLVKAIRRGAEDDRITSLILDVKDLFGGGLSKLQEVGRALDHFKASGKPITAVSDSYTQEQFFLASYADEVVMHPMGAMILTGYSSYRHYMKSAIDKLSIKMHIFRTGDYKDAVEPYLRNDMSDASREHNSRWLHELWSVYTRGLEERRDLTPGSINDYINNMDQHLAASDGKSALAARNAGLVDTLATNPEQQQLLISQVGEDDQYSGYRALDFRHYLSFLQREDYTAKSKNRIGLLVANGVILDGEQPPGTIGSDTLTQLIRQARDDENIKALVVRVDSGGGSAFASEVIRQELAATRETGKPVLISMGSVAASGGYWMSMGASEVWAQPTTLTGSIGVFSAFPTFEESLTRLGVSSDGISTTKLGGALQLDRPLSPLAANLVQQSVDSIYDQFLQLVAEARDSTPQQIHVVGEGRVWTGAAARQLGLVDELGDLEAVIGAAAERAGLDAFRVQEIQLPLSPAERLAQKLTRQLTALGAGIRKPSGTYLANLWATTERQLGALLELLDSGDPRSVYARCLECIAL